jgi:fibronectin type 3 domain-containing protein
MIHNTTSGDDIMTWTKAAADELLKWNPDASTLCYWQVTDNDWNISDRLDDFKTAIQYFHDKFRHVSMLPSSVERHTIATVYPISYAYRYGTKIDLNPGQIDIDTIYAKDLRWDPVPTDGCLIPWIGRSTGPSQTNDTLAHEKIEQAVENGSGTALSGFDLRELEDYYEGADIPGIYKSMFQSEGWTHTSRPGFEPHYLTFNGTFDPGQLNDTVGTGHWFQLEASSTANIIVGEHPYAGLYEADYGAGRIIGYGSPYDPFKEYLTDEISATYGDEYFVRLVEKCAGKEGSFRLWDVGKTYVYKEDNNTYYALLVERYGFSRNVPLIVYGAEHFRIIDMDTGGEIPNNSSVYLEENSTRLFKIKLGVPSAPQNLQSDAGDGYVNLSWEAPYEVGGSAITRYNIYRNGTLVDFDFVPPDQLWYIDTDVINGLTYTYNVTAVNIIGESPSSTHESATPLGPPGAPENLHVDAGDGYVNLTWEGPSDNGGSPITAYNIYRDDTAGVYGTVFAGQLWFYDDYAAYGVKYTYDVTAVNIIGEGDDASISATPTTVPSAPQNLLATAENGFIVLTWSTPTDDGGSVIMGYNIYRDGTVTVFGTVSETQLSYEDNDVTDGITYTYYVSASNIAGEGALSNAAEAKSGSEPQVPSNFTATAGDSYVYFNWDIPASIGGYPVTNYTIYRGTVPGDETLLIILGNVLSYNDTTVVNDVTYYYKITATNDIAEGIQSNSISATPQASVIPVNEPPTLVITSPSEGTSLKGIIDISGTSSDTDGSIQRVEIRIDDGNWITVSGTTSWTHSLDTTQLSDGDHTITVRAYDGENYSAETEISIIVANPQTEEEDEPESPIFWILVIIIMIVIMLFLLLAKRKKKPAPESVASGAEQAVEETPPQQAEVMFECPLCNTQVNGDENSCPGCGAIFAGEEEAPASS